MGKLSLILKIYAFILLVLAMIPLANLSQSYQTNQLAKTSANNSTYGPVQPKEFQDNSKPDCNGLWLDTRTTGKIYLDAISLSSWGPKSNPSLILETYNNIKNYVIIGHNICYYGNCFSANSQFAQIINLEVGDKVSACLGGITYSGYVFISHPIKDTDVQVMNDWTGFKTITMFTSYGNCKDFQCTSTDQRWLVALERDK